MQKDIYVFSISVGTPQLVVAYLNGRTQMNLWVFLMSVIHNSTLHVKMWKGHKYTGYRLEWIRKQYPPIYNEQFILLHF